MQLNISTDYAIRIVLYLSSTTNRTVSSKELSEKLGISQNLIFKIGKKLNEKQILKVSAGVEGGFRLNCDSQDISIYDVITIMEKTCKINRCLEDDSYCSRDSTQICPVRKAYGKIQTSLEESLKKITFKDLL